MTGRATWAQGGRVSRGKEEPPDGVYNHFSPGDRVRFYLPNAGTPDGMATGTVVRAITRDSDLPHGRAPVGHVSKQSPEYLISMDTGTAGRIVELTGAALTKLPSA